MFTNHSYNALSILVTLLVVLNYSFFCIAHLSNISPVGAPVGAPVSSPENDDPFFWGVATWYGDATGAGSGGACGLAADVKDDPYYGMISAGNDRIFLGGKGCGTCYEVKCTDNEYCSGRPIRVTITDECPGTCNNDAFHFDLSGLAFGDLAKPGQESKLRNAGRINLQFRRVKCYYNKSIKFRIDSGSNKYYLVFVVENLNGYGDIAHIEVQPSNEGANWMSAQNSWGVTWKFDVPSWATGPYSLRITGPENTTSVTAYNVIPDNWVAGQYYYSNVNFYSLINNPSSYFIQH